MFKLIIACIKKASFVNLLTIVILLLGTYSFFQMQREQFPSVDYNVVVFNTIYKGASPKEIEKLITNPLEKAIKEVDNLDEVGSFSIESLSGITIRVNPDANYQKTLDDLKTAVDSVELPKDADKTTYFELSSEKDPIIEIGIVSREQNLSVETEKKLRQRARALEDKLLAIDEVGKVNKNGWRDREIQVELDVNSLNQYEVTGQNVVDALKKRNVNVPGGRLFDIQFLKNIRTIGEFEKIEEIENLPIRSNEAGQKIFIKDVAKVKNGLEEPTYLNRINGKRGISLIILKKSNADVIDLTREVSKVVQEYANTFPEFEYSVFRDVGERVEYRLDLLMNNLMIGFILVLCSLFLFLNWQISLMTALGIPVALGLAFTIMAQMDITINLLSMIALVIVSGIIVDDAIIICENIYSHIEDGLSPYEATVKGTIEIFPSVLAAVSTTMAAFAPMIFMSGIFGKFVSFLPMVVIIALVASLIEAFLILPSHVYEAAKFRKKGSKSGEKELKWFEYIKNKFYLPSLKKALNFPKLTLLFFVSLLIFSVTLGFQFGRFKLFPGQIEQFYIKVTAPTGYTLERTEDFVEIVEEKLELYGEKTIESYTSRVGIQQTRHDDPFTKRGRNYAYLQVDLRPEVANANEIIEKLRKDSRWLLKEEEVLKRTGKNLGKLESLEFELGNPGPPVGKPIAVKIMGNEFETLEEIAIEIKTILKDIEGVKDLGDNFSLGNEEIQVKVDESLASRTNLSIVEVSNAISTAYLGKTATKIKDFDEEIGIRVVLPRKDREDLDALKKLHVYNRNQQLIPIEAMLKYEKTQGYSTITHLHNKRVFTVLGSINEEITTAQTVNNNLARRLEEKGIYQKYPEYEIKLGGEFEDTQQSLDSLKIAFGIGFFVILIILTLIFGSFKQSFIILSIIPFTLIGVILAFLVHGQYFGFLPFLGVVGLSGVVINDSIILVDKANQLKKENPNMSIIDILIKTGESRIRAVLLTTITTALGLLPTAYGIGGDDIFIRLMALGFGWGLVFASALTLILVPVLYLLLEKSKKIQFKKKKT